MQSALHRHQVALVVLDLIRSSFGGDEIATACNRRWLCDHNNDDDDDDDGTTKTHQTQQNKINKT